MYEEEIDETTSKELDKINEHVGEKKLIEIKPLHEGHFKIL